MESELQRKCLVSSSNSNLDENSDLIGDGDTALPTNWLVSIGSIEYLAKTAGDVIIEPSSS